MNNHLYDFLKTFVTITLPFTTAVYILLASIWDVFTLAAVSITIAVFNGLLGIVLAISSKRWNNSETRYDGELNLTGDDPETGMPNLQLMIKGDPNEFADGGTVQLRFTNKR